MKIYFNGDSNTAATELPSVECGYAYKLAKKLGADSIRNDSYAGCSNMRIIKTTESYLRECDAIKSYPDFMIIGWTSYEREEWWSDEMNEPISLNTHIFAFDEIKSTPRYQYWFNYQAMDNHYSIQMAKFYNTQIHNLHLELKNRKISHLFFPAIQSFSYFEARIDHKDFARVFRLDWHDNFLNAYDENFSMINWIEDRGFQEITPKQAHYPEPAQEAWADYLEKYIREKALV